MRIVTTNMDRCMCGDCYKEQLDERDEGTWAVHVRDALPGEACAVCCGGEDNPSVESPDTWATEDPNT